MLKNFLYKYQINSNNNCGMSQNKRAFDVYISRKKLFICSNQLLPIVQCHFSITKNALDKRAFSYKYSFLIAMTPSTICRSCCVCSGDNSLMICAGFSAYAGASQLEQAKQHAKCSLDAFTKRRNGVSCICLSILFVILGVAINL